MALGGPFGHAPVGFAGGRRRAQGGASMFLKVGRKLINTDNLVDADVYEPGEALSPYGDGHADALTVVITTTAVETAEDGTLGARRIVLEGEDADLFLEALPVYAPVLEQ